MCRNGKGILSYTGVQKGKIYGVQAFRLSSKPSSLGKNRPLMTRICYLVRGPHFFPS